MRIPIANVYYLLCYAWDKLEEQELVKIEPAKTTTLVDLFAKVLTSGISHLLKRGFDRGYLLHSEDTRLLRGKIGLQPTLKRNLLIKAQVHCEFDELSYDVLHNQILMTTLSNLLTVTELDDSLRGGLAQHYRRLHEVQEIKLSKRAFSNVRLNRNNYFYDFLLRVCELLFDNLLPTERVGAWRFRSFLQDEKQMRLLFENFVRNFFKREAQEVLGTQEFAVKREDIQWNLSAAGENAARLLPKMQTDVSIISMARKWIIECKFTPRLFQELYGVRKLRSEHLYQVNSYLDNLPNDPLNNSCNAILLYPTTDRSLQEQYERPNGQTVSVRTINLNQPWQRIHRDLLALIA